MAGEFITVARVLKTQGRHGEVAVEVHSDVPDRFSPGLELSVLAPDGSRRALSVEGLWPHKGQLVLKFAGIDSISDAETLLRCELQVPASARGSLEPGWNYISDLVGAVVSDNGREIGTVQDVRFGAGEAPLLVVRVGAKEHEIPYAEAFLKKLDFERRRIEMSLPEGLLEINGPLTDEEKQEQKRQS